MTKCELYSNRCWSNHGIDIGCTLLEPYKSMQAKQLRKAAEDKMVADAVAKAQAKFDEEKAQLSAKVEKEVR